MGRYAGPLLGVGLLVAFQFANSTLVYLVWRHDVRRVGR